MLLEDYLSTCRGRMFNWPEWNCVHFTGEWVAYAEGSRAILNGYTQYTLTPLAALRFARSLGGLRQAYTALLQRDPLPPLAARIGDVALFDSPGAGVLGICNGTSAVILHPAGGFSSMPMGAASCVWKIDCRLPST